MCSGALAAAAANPALAAAWASERASAAAAKRATGWKGPTAAGKLRRPATSAAGSSGSTEGSAPPADVFTAHALMGGRQFFRAQLDALMAAASPADFTRILHDITMVLTSLPHERFTILWQNVTAEVVGRAFDRISGLCFPAHGDGAGDGIPPRGLCEGMLEFYEACAAPAAGEAVKHASARAQQLADQGIFAVMYRILDLHAGHSQLTQRALRLSSTIAQIAMAAGKDVPPAADEAFDRWGGIADLTSLIRAAAEAGDTVVLTLALRTLSGVRLHSDERREAARRSVPLLAAILAGAPLPAQPRPYTPPPVVVVTQGTSFSTTYGSTAADCAAAPLCGDGGGAAAPVLGEAAAHAAPSAPVVAELTPSAAAAAVVALARAVEGAKGQWTQDDVDAIASALLLTSAEAPGGSSDVSSSLILPGGSQALRHHMDESVASVMGQAEGAPPPMFPLWEAVVLAGALRSLRKSASAAEWSRRRLYPTSLIPLIKALPRAPGSLESRAAVMQFRPGTLRSRIATDYALVAEVAAVEAASAVPMWLQVAVAPVAFAWLGLKGAWWGITTLTVQVAGRLILLLDAASSGVARLLTFTIDVIVIPLVMGLYNYVLAPVANGIVAVLEALATGISAIGRAIANGIVALGSGIHRYVLIPLRDAAVWLWQHTFVPLGHGVQAVIRGFYNWVLVPIWSYLIYPVFYGIWWLIHNGAQCIATSFSWIVRNLIILPLELLWRYIVTPFFRGIFTVLRWIGIGIRAVLTTIWRGAEWVYVHALLPVAQAIWTVLTAIGRGISAVFSAIWTGISTVFRFIGRGFSIVFSAIGTVLQRIGVAIADVFRLIGRGFGAVVNALAAGINRIGLFLMDGLRFIGRGMMMVLRPIGRAIRAVYRGVSSVIAGVARAVGAVVSAAGRAVARVGASISQAVSNVTRPIAAAVRASAVAVRQAARQVSQAFRARRR